jgi:peptide/nickel transport system permease protein
MISTPPQHFTQFRKGVSAASRGLQQFGLPGIFAGCLLLVAILGPLLLNVSPLDTSAERLEPPSGRHIFGTDNAGRDVFARTVFAARIDLTIAIASALLSGLVGTIYGLVAGHSRRFVGPLMMRALDVIQAFPAIIFAMTLVVFSGQSLRNIVLAVAFVTAPTFARLARATVMEVRDMAFVRAATCAGCSTRRILIGHILPSFRGPGFEQLSTTISLAIILTAGLSFVGAGVQVPTPEWGAMVAIGARSLISGEWWASVFPGIAILLTSLAFGVLGARLRRTLGSRGPG